MQFWYALISLLPFTWAQADGLMFMKNAFLAILVITPLFGLLSTMVVTNRMSFFSDALGHSAFTGMAVGTLAGALAPTPCAVIFAVVFALLFTVVQRKAHMSSDTVIGVFSSTAVALGIFVATLGGQSFTKFNALLIGDVLSVAPSEIALLLLILVGVVILWLVSLNQILLSGIHPALADSRGTRVAVYEALFAVAIALVVVVLSLLQLPARQLHLSSFWLEKGSYALVGVLGLILCWRALKKLRALLQKPKFKTFTPHHVHNEHCGCGHQHLPTQEQLQSGDDWRARLMIVLSMGMRPCSGAIMVLLFSKVIGVFGWGMLSALAMAAGTSLTISSLALLVHSFRQLAVKLSGNKTPVLWRQVGWTTLALAGGVILLVAAVTMWMSAAPFSTLSPLGRGLR